MKELVFFVIVMLFCWLVAQAIINSGKKKTNSDQWEEYNERQSKIEEKEKELEELRGGENE